MIQRLILSLPGDTNMLDLADALHSIGLGISAIAGRDGEIVVGKLMYHEPRITNKPETTHEQQ